jgi:hypothetical protein
MAALLLYHLGVGLGMIGRCLVFREREEKASLATASAVKAAKALLRKIAKPNQPDFFWEDLRRRRYEAGAAGGD